MDSGETMTLDRRRWLSIRVASTMRGESKGQRRSKDPSLERREKGLNVSKVGKVIIMNSDVRYIYYSLYVAVFFQRVIKST